MVTRAFKGTIYVDFPQTLVLSCIFVTMLLLINSSANDELFQFILGREASSVEKLALCCFIFLFVLLALHLLVSSVAQKEISNDSESLGQHRCSEERLRQMEIKIKKEKSFALDLSVSLICMISIFLIAKITMLFSAIFTQWADIAENHGLSSEILQYFNLPTTNNYIVDAIIYCSIAVLAVSSVMFSCVYLFHSAVNDKIHDTIENNCYHLVNDTDTITPPPYCFPQYQSTSPVTNRWTPTAPYPYN